MYGNSKNNNIQNKTISFRGVKPNKSLSLSSRLKNNCSATIYKLSSSTNSSFASSLSTNVSHAKMPPSSLSVKNRFAEKKNKGKYSRRSSFHYSKWRLRNSADITISQQARVQQQHRFDAYLRSLDASFRAKSVFAINHIPHAESGLGNVINGIMTTAYIAAVSNRSFHSTFLVNA